MYIKQFRYFIAVAEDLHFGRAAARLNLSQPPLSRQVAALERELGVTLLDRHSRHVALTAAGRRLLLDARAAVVAFDQACRNARLAELGELGELGIAFMMHAAYTVVPELTRRFSLGYPQVNVTLREAFPNLLESDVANGRFDVGIMFPRAARTRLTVKPIFREPLCLALHPGHPLAAKLIITAADLEGEPLIAVPDDVAPTLRQAIAAYFETAGLVPLVKFEVQLQQTIVSMVAERLGVALVPRSLRRLGVADVVFRELDRAPSVDHVAVWRADNPNPALRSFLAVLADYCSENGSGQSPVD
jgi:DNA-binding transcriptional LysR family regulator